MKNIKNKKIVLLALSACLITSYLPTKTSFGPLKFLQTNKIAIATIGHLALAGAGIMALSSKDSMNTKKYFYLGTFGGSMLALSGLSDSIKVIKSFITTPISEKTLNTTRKFWNTLESLAKTFDTFCSLITGKKVNVLS